MEQVGGVKKFVNTVKTSIIQKIMELRDSPGLQVFPSDFGF